MKYHKYWGGLVSAAAILSADVLLSVPAVAQIDEIIVTARKREESLQTVPLSVTAFTSEQIQQIAPRTLQDLDGFSPNVFIGQQTAVPGGGAIYIRGEGYSDVEKTQNPSVGVILDDVFLGVNTGQLIDAFDIQSLEINRGPQGVLFGKNTTGGVLRAQRSRPTGEFGFKASGAYGSDDEYRFRVIGNAPIVEDKVALKLGGTINRREGYTDNIFLQVDEGYVDYMSATAELLITPVEELEILFGFDFIEDRSGLLPVEQITDGDQPYISHADFGNNAQYDAKLYRAKVEWDSPVGVFTSISAFLDTSDRALQDFDGSNFIDPNAPVSLFERQGLAIPAIAGGPVPGLQLHTDRIQEYDQFTQEIRWNETFFDDRLDVLIGGFYYWHEVNLRQFSDQFNDGVYQAIAAFTMTPALFQGFESDQISSEENKAYSVFGSVIVDITETLSLSAGFRHIHEEKEQNSQFDSLLTPGIDTIVPRTEDSWNYTTPKVGLDWQATEDILLYGFYAQGFRSGGISIRGVPAPAEGVNAEDLVYEPEIVKTWEFGVKSQWFEDQLRLNISGFITNREDSQTNLVSFRPSGAVPATNTVIANVDRVDVSGIEVEMLAVPEMIPGLSVGATYGWLTGKSQPDELPLGFFGLDPTTSACPNPDLVNLTCLGSSAGLTRSPEHQVGANVSYTRPLGIGEVNVSANWFYRSEIEWIAGIQVQGNREPGYHVVNGGISYAFETNGVDVRAAFTGKNIFDERYRAAALPTIDFQSWEAPRTWLFELAVAYN